VDKIFFTWLKIFYMSELETLSLNQAESKAENKLVENQPKEAEVSKVSAEASLASSESEATPPIAENLCRGYGVDPITKLHLCQDCAYHKYRNQTKP
jgi:hypothetical protein